MPQSTRPIPASRHTRSSPVGFIRYLIIGIHVILVSLCIILSAILTGSWIQLIIHGALTIAMLVYIPAALVISIRDSTSSFDQAGGEVAYVVVQLAGWIASAIIAFILRYLTEDCVEGLPLILNEIGTRCHTHFAIGILSIVNVVLSITWLTWITWIAHHTLGLTPSQAYTVPTHKLLNRTYGEDTEVDLYETGGGAIAPFMTGRSPAYRQPAHQQEEVPGYNDPYYTPNSQAGLLLQPQTGSDGITRVESEGSQHGLPVDNAPAILGLSDGHAFRKV